MPIGNQYLAPTPIPPCNLWAATAQDRLLPFFSTLTHKTPIKMASTTKPKAPAKPREKRARADSAASAVKAMVDAAQPDIEVPDWVTLTESAKPFWIGVVRARARDEWQEVDLVVAAQLAQCQADIAEEDAALRDEGRVIRNERGTPVMNPRTTVLEQLARREMALMRTLRMGGRVAGDTRDELGKRQLERGARKARAQVEEEDEGLLA